MESIFPLGCILDKSSTTLRMTSDPRERRGGAITLVVFGLGWCLLPILWLLILDIPFSRLGWEGLLAFVSFGILLSLLGFLIGLCRTEIEFDISRGQVIRRRFCMGRLLLASALPVDQLKIRAVEGNKGSGELQLVRADGKVWTKWGFLVEASAQETRREILDWLREHSVSIDREDAAGLQK